jgi:hypothetical protein
MEVKVRYMGANHCRIHPFYRFARPQGVSEPSCHDTYPGCLVRVEVTEVIYMTSG